MTSYSDLFYLAYWECSIFIEENNIFPFWEYCARIHDTYISEG